MRAAHEAQVIPIKASSTFFVGATVLIADSTLTRAIYSFAGHYSIGHYSTGADWVASSMVAVSSKARKELKTCSASVVSQNGGNDRRM